MSSALAPRDRLCELLADRALGEDLSPGDHRDLERLLTQFPEVDPESYGIAAAAIHIAYLAAGMEQLPQRLRKRLLKIANGLSRPGPRTLSRLRSPWLGWGAAVAASMLLMASLMEWTDLPSLEDVQSAPDSLSVAWATTGDPAGAFASGSVFWSDQLDAGFLTFDGLPANAPDENQYQLWIFDASRPAEYPVDGGVFDSPGAAFQVPIDPKLDVDNATLFAITLERPGGVVVSTRERLLLTAAP